MNSVRGRDERASKCQSVEFWPGQSAQVDFEALAESAVPVKGVSYRSPLRFLEIYANASATPNLSVSHSGSLTKPELTWQQIEEAFVPRIPGVEVQLGPDIPQPPFTWRDADASHVALSFTYNTNAFFRIFKTLEEERQIAASDVDSFVDKACVLLTGLYKARNHFLIRNINNNFNMFLISKVVEFLIGKKRYDCERQELRQVRRSLSLALSMAPDHEQYTVTDKMGLAVGSGVCFVERRIQDNIQERIMANDIQEVCYQYFRKPMAIDHRSNLLDMIFEAGVRKNSFTLAVILDDATESVLDLLWLQDLMEQFPFFRANLLVNTAQISINFSSHLLEKVWRTPCFHRLVSKLHSQFLVTKIYCPFISFQTSLLPLVAKRAIGEADAVYIKGANFFETCQIPEKETFYAFVVYGPISRAYTGLQDFDGVFAHVPAGTTGYNHRAASQGGIVNLADIVNATNTRRPLIEQT